MRVEIGVGEAIGTPRGSDVATLARPAPARRIDWFDLSVLGLFGAVSLWILGLDLWQVIVHGRVWTGTDGVYIVDQMQYLAWIQSASHHFFSSNLFVLHGTAADYFQPAVTISAGLTALGMAPTLALLLWKPVAVVCMFFAVRAYCRRSLVGTWARRAVLVLALFFGSFTTVNGDFGVVGDMMPSFLSWGYTFGLLAIGLLVFALLAYDRSRRTGRAIWVAGSLGALASLLHPWQGELLVVVILGAELVMWRNTRRRPRELKLPIVTLFLTGLALLYYMVLGKTDPSWEMARDASKHAFSIWTILLAVAPLIIPAAFAYRGRSGSFLTAVTRTWPFAALAVWVLSASQVSATPLHAFDGITIPLAILAVKGTQRLRLYRLPRARLLAVLAVAVATIPATAYLLHTVADLAAPAPGNANFITADEQRALNYLSHDASRGGVLTRFYLGAAVPADTGRRTYVGDCLWSEPDCNGRAESAQALLDGSLSPAQAQAFVLGTRARFVLSDCSSSADLSRELGPILTGVTRFGCAAIYQIGPARAPS
jgi:hypothetical protein